MKFKYVGPIEGDVFAYSHSFPKGEAVDIKDEWFVEKAKSNPEFEEVKRGNTGKSKGEGSGKARTKEAGAES